MPVHDILLFGKNPLFLEFIERLLIHPEINCVCKSFSEASPLDEIKKHRPDVVIIEKTGAEKSLEIMEILKANTSKIRVLELSLSNNELRVYQHQKLTVGKTEDLLNFILD